MQCKRRQCVALEFASCTAARRASQLASCTPGRLQQLPGGLLIAAGPQSMLCLHVSSCKGVAAIMGASQCHHSLASPSRPGQCGAQRRPQRCPACAASRLQRAQRTQRGVSPGRAAGTYGKLTCKQTCNPAGRWHAVATASGFCPAAVLQQQHSSAHIHVWPQS